MLLSLMVLFIAGNLLSALAPSYGVLMVGRFLAAFAHGAYFGVGSVVAADLVAPQKRASAIALMFTGLTLANVLGVPLGTWIGQAFGWRATFWVVVAIGVVGLAGVLARVPRQPRPAPGGLVRELSTFRKGGVWLGQHRRLQPGQRDRLLRGRAHDRRRSRVHGTTGVPHVDGFRAAAGGIRVLAEDEEQHRALQARPEGGQIDGPGPLLTFVVFPLYLQHHRRRWRVAVREHHDRIGPIFRGGAVREVAAVQPGFLVGGYGDAGLGQQCSHKRRMPPDELQEELVFLRRHGERITECSRVITMG
ncbi:MFS transporter [Nonomuraea sp. M3C6]|uniref:MFS transporter n=1 Tax=Nonomuraea marmarensis TaxID=3351344 RepID=A0ABW7A829_9ACTN